MDKPRKTPKPTPYHTSAPDLSKLIRCTEDAIEDAGLLRNDSRISEYGFMGKRYAEPGEPTGCLIIVEVLPPKESEHVETKERPGKRGGRGRNRRDASAELAL